MLKSKLSGYMGFAARARKLQTGYNTVLGLVEKRKTKLVIIAEDAAEGTRDKISGKCRSHNVPCVIFGESDEHEAAGVHVETMHDERSGGPREHLSHGILHVGQLLLAWHGEHPGRLAHHGQLLIIIYNV